MSDSFLSDVLDPAASVSDFTEEVASETGSARPRSPTSTPAEPSRKRKRLNDALWAETRLLKAGEAVRDKHRHEIYYCKHCTKYKGTTNAQRFRDHLLSEHRVRIEATQQSEKRTAYNNTIVDIFGKQMERHAGRNIEQEKLLKSAIQEPEFKEACTRLITVRNLPHSLLDWPEFWACILSVNYMATDTLKLARDDVPKLISSTYYLHRTELLNKLQKSLSWIHFSIDMWTSPAKKGFQANVAYWVDADSRRIESALLSLKEFKGTHGGEEQARVFMEVIREAGLQEKLGFFISDNHTSNDKMLRHIANEIDYFDPILRRIRCFGHILNLVSQAFLFGSSRQSGEDRRDQNEAIDLAIQDISQLSKSSNLDTEDKAELALQWRHLGSLGKLHNINVWSRASTERYNEFVAAVGRAIPLDNDTRWNSWFTEVNVTLVKRKEIRDWIEEHWCDLGEDILTREDWQELEDIKEFLQPFVDCTLNTQGMQASLDTTFTNMEFLIKHFNDMKIKHSENPQFNSRVHTAWFKFDKYYKLSDDTAVYTTSILLHPELRQTYLEMVWAYQKKYIKPAIEASRKLWRKYFKPADPSGPTVDLNAIKDPVKRWRAEMTRSSAIIEEFEDFITV